MTFAAGGCGAAPVAGETGGGDQTQDRVLLEIRTDGQRPGFEARGGVTRIYADGRWEREATDGQRAAGRLAAADARSLARQIRRADLALIPNAPVCAGLPTVTTTVTRGTDSVAFTDCVNLPVQSVVDLLDAVDRVVPPLAETTPSLG
jgi:hypothetical protein